MERFAAPSIGHARSRPSPPTPNLSDLPAPSLCIHFLRHGLAGQRSKWRGNDADRPLSERGRTQVRSVSRVLRDAGIQTNLIVTSPFTRAIETAEIVSEAYGLPESPTVERGLQPGSTLDQLVAVPRTYCEIEAVLIVGHEPGLSYLISALCGRRQPLLQKAGPAEISFDRAEPRRWRVRWQAGPREFVEFAHRQAAGGRISL